VKGATPIRARRPDAGGIRVASHDSASLAGRPIRATSSETLLNHRPLTTPVPLHARWGLSRLSSHQSRSHRRNTHNTYLFCGGFIYQNHLIPGMARVCLTYDFDGVAPWIWNYDMPRNHKQGVFGADVGTPRLLDLHDEHGIPSTWFIPGHTIESFPEACEDVRDRGHEIQHHTWSHAPRPSYDTREAEEHDLVRAIETIEDLTGETPTGFRASAGGFSEYTIELVEEYGFDWVSTDKERDFEPYYVRKGTSLPRDGPYQRGKKTDLVNVPYQWQRDDWIQMGPIPKGGIMADAVVFDRWRREFDWMIENVEDGVFVLLLHPQISGRASTVSLLDEFIQYAREQGADFVDASTVAAQHEENKK